MMEAEYLIKLHDFPGDRQWYWSGFHWAVDSNDATVYAKKEARQVIRQQGWQDNMFVDIILLHEVRLKQSGNEVIFDYD